MFLRIFGFLISAVVSLVIYFEVSNTKFSSVEPNKDKLLVDLKFSSAFNNRILTFCSSENKTCERVYRMYFNIKLIAIV